MKVLITENTVAGGKPVFIGEIHSVSQVDALILRECGKATSNPQKIAAREAELAAPVIETAESKPVVEIAAKKSSKKIL